MQLWRLRPHGIAEKADEKFSVSEDPSTDFQVTVCTRVTAAAHGRNASRDRRSCVSMFSDAGVAFYTYKPTATMAYFIKAQTHIAFTLDRPKFARLRRVECADAGFLRQDKYGRYYLRPIRYGLTSVELSPWSHSLRGKSHWGSDLHVIAMKNWHRIFFSRAMDSLVPAFAEVRTVKARLFMIPGYRSC